MIDLIPVVTMELLDGTMHPIYGLQPKQWEAYCKTPLVVPPGQPYPRNVGYGGAAGGGKSYLARAVCTAAAFQWPGSTSLIIRRTKDEVIINHVLKFKDEVPERLPDGQRLYSYNGDLMCATFVNGSRIFFGFLRDFDDTRRYQGNEFDVIVFEEATHYGFPEVRWIVGNRNRATTDKARPFVLYPSNPGSKGHHWYKRLFIERNYHDEYMEEADDYDFVQAKVSDNLLLLERDPAYIKALSSLPEPYRSWLRDGDWEAGLGLALPMLKRAKHLVTKFRPPSNWFMWGAFDWGFSHPFSFGIYAANEDGRVWKIDTITGRMLQPHEINEAIRSRLAKIGYKLEDLRYISCGRDIWADHKARGENVPTIAERLYQWGWKIVPANVSRISGLNNLRTYLSWKGVFPDGTDDAPYLMFMDTPGNRECFVCLEGLAVDDDNPEDAQKLDADSFGRGGDDTYDETRYALASRPQPARTRFEEEGFSAFSEGVLRREAEYQRTGRMPKARSVEIEHPEFGGVW